MRLRVDSGNWLIKKNRNGGGGERIRLVGAVLGLIAACATGAAQETDEPNHGPKIGDPEQAKCRVLPYRGKIDGVSCTIVIASEPRSDHVFYWLDPNRDYIVLREHRMADGREYSRTEISYRSDKQLGWIPTGWKEAVVDEHGGFDDLVTSQVTELVVNEPLPESTFRIDFPKGAEMN